MGMGKLLPRPVKKALRKILTINIDTRAVYEFPPTVAKKQFEGKTAVITGGGGGIGSAVALRLAAEGAFVYVLGRTQSALECTVAEIKKLGGMAGAYAVDVTDYAAVERCAASISDKCNGGGVYLVGCAGGSARSRARPFAEQDIAVMEDVIRTNLLGTVNCCRAFAPVLVRSGGSIVNVSSIIGIGGKAQCSDYAAAKAGIIGFTRSLAIELSPLGVRCNTVSPGKIQRGVMAQAGIENEIRCNYLGYGGRPEDIAGAVSFLLSDDAKFITGQNIIVDGGRTLGLHGD